MQNRIFRYEIWIAPLLLFMPIILIGFDYGNIRSSLSDYVYMKHNQVFYFLMFLAATMFSNNGALWVKNYNIVLGALLAGVALTPYLEYPIPHYIFAAGFFLGSVIVMILFSSKSQRIYKIYAGVFIVLGMWGHFIMNWYSLFYAEWLGMLPICIHFIGESKGKIN